MCVRIHRRCVVRMQQNDQWYILHIQLIMSRKAQKKQCCYGYIATEGHILLGAPALPLRPKRGASTCEGAFPVSKHGAEGQHGPH